MLDTQNDDLPGLGHNNPPPYRKDVAEAHAVKAEEFLDAAAQWLEAGDIDSETQAEKLNDFIFGIQSVLKDAEEDRKTDKKPIDAQAKQIQNVYNPIKTKLETALHRVNPLMHRWMDEKRKRQQAEARKLREEAEAKAQEAEEERAKAAVRNDIGSAVDAETKIKEAERARKAAQKAEETRVQVGSATGGAKTRGQRTTWEPEIIDMALAFKVFCADPDLKATLLKLAAARARSKDFDPRNQTIPGFALHERTS